MKSFKIASFKNKKALRNVIFFLVISLGVAYPPLVMLLRSIQFGEPVRTPIQFFTSDTFYYLTIARHSVGKPFYTADGSFPTNGFHPLWEWILKSLFGMPLFLQNSASQILLTFGLSFILVWVGATFFGFASYRVTHNFGLSLLAAAPGFYYILFSPVSQSYDGIWSFINGMESPLSICFFGIFLYLLINKRLLYKPKPFAVILSAVLMTLIIFSRLDDAFLLIPYLAITFFFSNSRKDAILNSGIAIGIPVIGVVLYVIHNYFYAGSLIPVSGLVKQGNWLFINIGVLILTFLPLALFKLNNIWAQTSMRALQMSVPMLAALFWVFREIGNFKKINWRLRPGQHYRRIVFTSLLVYVAVKGLYNFVFVYILGQGHWYYPISILIFNFMLAISLAMFLRNTLTKSVKLAMGMISVLAVCLYANSFINYKDILNYNSGYYDFWLQSQIANQQLLKIDKNMKIVEYDDGIMSYLLDVPVMNGLGFTLDYQAYKAQEAGTLLNLAYRRGFHVLGVMSYIKMPPNIDNDSGKIRKALQGMPGIQLEDLNQWNFKIIYRLPDTDAVFVEFSPQ